MPGRGSGREPAVELERRCSFCNRAEQKVRKLIAGPSVFICDECVRVCVDILADERVTEDTAAALKARWPAGEPGIRCTLCGTLGEIEEALFFENRAAVCRAGVALVAEAATGARGSDDEKQ